MRATRRRKPGEELWAVWRRNLDGSEPRYYLSNAPEGTTLETLAYVGGSRWRIETEFETEKGDVGLDEYETRSWAGWHHHIAMCLLGGAFLLSLQQDLGGKRCPGSRGHRCTGWCGRCCPGSSSGPINCCCGWRIRSYATNGLAVPTRDAAPPAAKAGWSRHLKPVVVVLALQRQLHKMDNYDFLLLDDLGYQPQGAEESEGLFTLIAHERSSLGITSNLVFSQWEHIFVDPMATTAAIDRVVHHSVILEFDVPGYRTGVA